MRKMSVQGLPYPSRLGRALIAVVVGWLSCASVVGAQVGFNFFNDTDIPGLDISPPESIWHGLAGAPEWEICRLACARNLDCMAFTWVPGAPSQCWYKASTRLFSNLQSLRVHRPGMFSGVKVFTNKPCWARHIFNFKICDVISHGTTMGSSTTNTLNCPEPSRTAMVPNRAIPGRFDHYCVAKRDDDPGNLPNCTDEFGGGLHEAGVLGNHINHTCLDAN